MDFASNYGKKLASFRIKELKGILGCLGLSKQGKKQDLVDKIIALLSTEVSNVRGLTKKNIMSKEEVAGVIDDAYRKLQGAGATSSSIDGGSSLRVNIPVHLDNRICCPCGSSFPNEHMIQCEDRHCCVLQHKGCVIVPDEASEAAPLIPSPFYCEICRINRADPFWVTLAQPLFPAKLIAANIPTDGTNPMHFVEKTFHLTRADKDLIQNMDCDIQVWCILLNDKVPFRMQWPLYSDLKVNGVPVRTVGRPGSQLLGANGRDDGPMIAFYLNEGINQISLAGYDARSFCLGVRVVKQRTVEQIIDVILKEQNCESFGDALARVRRCVGGGMAMADEDSGSDLEVIADCVTVSLRCPMSGSRIKTAGRFRPCAHMACFDVEIFVRLNQRSRKWQCPTCLKNYSLEDITIDHYFNHIAKMMQDCAEDIVEIEVRPDGSWRVKNGYQFKNLGYWHLPDENLDTAVLPRNDGSMGHINPKEESIPWDLQTSPRNSTEEYLENNIQKVTVSRGSSGSHRDDGDYSIYQDHVRNNDISANSGIEINAMSYDSSATARAMNENTSVSFGDLDLIVLSDSEGETANLTSPATFSMTPVVSNDEHSFSGPHGISDVFLGDPVFSAGMGYNTDFEMAHQAFASDAQDGSPYQQLYLENASDTLIDSEYPSVTSSAPVDGGALTSNTTVDLGRQSDLGNNPQTSNGICQENLIPLGFDSNNGGGNGSAAIHAATSNGLDLVKQCGSNEVSLPLHMNDDAGSIGTNSGRRGGPFSFPRRPRSVRRP